jgi:hypothetical protein
MAFSLMVNIPALDPDQFASSPALCHLPSVSRSDVARYLITVGLDHLPEEIERGAVSGPRVRLNIPEWMDEALYREAAARRVSIGAVARCALDLGLARV